MLLRRRHRKRKPLPARRFPRWTRHEEMVVGRFARALLRGEYSRATDAARACLPELARQQRKQPRGLWPASPRKVKGVQAKIIEIAHARNEVWPGAWWRKEEDAVIAPFARALAKGRYGDLKVAAADCYRELGVKRRLHPDIPWLGRRGRSAVEVRVEVLAHRFGWIAASQEWSRPESRLIDRYARILAASRHQTVESVVPRVHQELARLSVQLRRAGKPVTPRNLDGVRKRLLTRSRELGRRAARLIDFTPEELRMVAAYAAAFRSGRFPSALAAARACSKGLARRRRRPRPRGFPVARPFCSVASKVLDSVHEQGVGPIFRRLSPPERARVEDYVRRVKAGELTCTAAAREFIAEVARLRERHPKLEWVQYRRSLHNVKNIIWKRIRGRVRVAS